MVITSLATGPYLLLRGRRAGPAGGAPEPPTRVRQQCNTPGRATHAVHECLACTVGDHSITGSRRPGGPSGRSPQIR